MLKVHFTPGTRAGRIIWLLEELGLEYEVNIMPFTKEGLKSPEHRARHALGRVPVLEDEDVSIFESGAIIQYVLERHKDGGLKPEPSSVDFPYYLQWFHYAEGMIMPMFPTPFLRGHLTLDVEEVAQSCRDLVGEIEDGDVFQEYTTYFNEEIRTKMHETEWFHQFSNQIILKNKIYIKKTLIKESFFFIKSHQKRSNQKIF
mgnify:CR=1 FL=1